MSRFDRAHKNVARSPRAPANVQVLLRGSMKKWIVLFAALGFIGAALFYSPYIGINAQAQIECPVCPHVTTLRGTPAALFVRSSLLMGIFNAALFVAIGSLGPACVWSVRHVLHRRV